MKSWSKASELFVIGVGIVLPLAALGVELVWHACAGKWFDPFPTPGYIALAAVVPLANLLVWAKCRRQRPAVSGWLGVANGLALGIAFYYTVSYLSVLPFAAGSRKIFVVVGIALLAFVGAQALRRRLVGGPADAGGGRVPGVRWGIALALVAAGLVTLPDALTCVGLKLAESDLPAREARGLHLLRKAGREAVMLRACYDRPITPLDWCSLALFARGEFLVEDARRMFFRVTGKGVEAVQRPEGAARAEVSLSACRLEGSVDAEATLADLQWTLALRNDSAAPCDAQAQLALPPAGAVSRLTLLINGAEREAAVERLDTMQPAAQQGTQSRPLAEVATSGPDRVKLVCLAIPPKGEIQVRIGIMTPLRLGDSPETGLLRLPWFLDCSFPLASNQNCAVSLQSKGTLAWGGEARGLSVTTNSDGFCVLQGALPAAVLASPRTVLSVHRPTGAETVFCANPGGRDFIIRQAINTKTILMPRCVAVVVDGSAPMAGQVPAIAKALGDLPPAVQFGVLFAGDDVQTLAELQPADPTNVARCATRLSATVCEGGRDNVGALEHAWDLLAECEGGAIVWVHGPQPLLLKPPENLLQRLMCRRGGPGLIDLQLGAGPSRLTERLGGLNNVQWAGISRDPGADLTALFASWTRASAQWVLYREKVPPLQMESSWLPVSPIVARLWALDQVRSCVASGDRRRLDEAADLSLRHHLVTPVTHAVVREAQP